MVPVNHSQDQLGAHKFTVGVSRRREEEVYSMSAIELALLPTQGDCFR